MARAMNPKTQSRENVTCKNCLKLMEACNELSKMW